MGSILGPSIVGNSHVCRYVCMYTYVYTYICLGKEQVYNVQEREQQDFQQERCGGGGGRVGSREPLFIASQFWRKASWASLGADTLHRCPNMGTPASPIRPQQSRVGYTMLYYTILC